MINSTINENRTNASLEIDKIRTQIANKISIADLDDQADRIKSEIEENIDKNSIKKEILDMFNSCSYFGGTLEEGLTCNDICKNPRIWGQNAITGQTCILAEFSSMDNSSFSKNIVRCGFQQDGRSITCVCCH